MPAITLRDTKGTVLATVEAPEGASRQDIIALAKAQKARGAPAAPKPEAGPDVVGRWKARLIEEPPAGAHQMFGEPEWPGRAVRALEEQFLPDSIPSAAAMAATLPFGGGAVTGPARAALTPVKRFAADLFGGNVVTAPLKRMAAAGVAGGGARLAQGSDLTSAGKEALYQAGTQGLGEVLPGMARFGMEQKAGRRLLKDLPLKGTPAYEDAVKMRRTEEAARVREARAQHQEQKAAMTRDFTARERARGAQFERQTALAKASHEARVRDYEQSGATMIAKSYDALVPAWQGMPTTERGLVDRVRGAGLDKMHERFDQAFRASVEQGRGKVVQLPLDDVEALGFKGMRTMFDERRRPMAEVPADALMERITGFWKKNPGVYRRSVRALDAKDIGDPIARGEYRAAQSLIEFADASQMLAGDRFNPAAARKGFDKLKNVELLRRRGMGHATAGPIRAAVDRPAPEVRLPREPAPATPPVMPPFRRPTPLPPVQAAEMPAGVTATTLPEIRWFEGAGLAELPFLISGMASGQYHYPEMAAAGGVGALGARLLSRQRFITNAPISPAARFATDVLPTLEAQQARKRIPEPAQ